MSIEGENREVLVDVDELYDEFCVNGGEFVVIKVESRSSKKQRGSALLQLRFIDNEGNVIPNPKWPYVSGKVNEYKYLNSASENRLVFTRFAVPVPEGATKLRVYGAKWKKAIDTLVDPRVRFQAVPANAGVPYDADGLRRRYNCSELEVYQPIAREASKVKVSLHHACEESSKVPVFVSFLKKDGELCLPASDLPQSPEFGPYFYLESIANKVRKSTIEIDVPADAEGISLKGRKWGARDPQIVGAINITEHDDAKSSLTAFIEEIPDDDYLLIIDTTAPPLGHQTLSLRPNNLTAAYNKMGLWVVFVPFSTVKDEPKRFSDRAFQINRDEFDFMINTVREKRLPLRSVYVCSSFPSLQALAAMHRLKTAGWKVIYECRDDMEEFNRVGYSKWYSPSLEREVLRAADVVVSVSNPLRDKLETLLEESWKHSVVPNAVNKSVIDGSEPLRTKEAFGLRESCKTVGYVGHLTKAWFDWPLIKEAAHRLPDVRFEIVGHGAPSDIVLPDNLLLLGPKTHDELRGIVGTWKTGLIPFVDIPLTRSVDPNKIYEYLAWGLRCVSAPMGMVHYCPSTWVYKGIDEFVAAVSDSLESPYTEGEIESINRFVSVSSWDDRAREICDVIGVPE